MIDSVHILDRDVFMDLDKWFIIINKNVKMENVVPIQSYDIFVSCLCMLWPCV
jgi:hypothetical protein